MILLQISQTDKMDRHRQEAIDIEVLKEILGLLRITKEYASDRNKTTQILIDEVSIALAPEVYNNIKQTVIPKSIILDLEQLDSDWAKFKDQ